VLLVKSKTLLKTTDQYSHPSSQGGTMLANAYIKNNGHPPRITRRGPVVKRTPRFPIARRNYGATYQ
jgi:hypothetical protein